MIGVIGCLGQSIFFFTILYTLFHVIKNYQLLYGLKDMKKSNRPLDAEHTTRVLRNYGARTCNSAERRVPSWCCFPLLAPPTAFFAPPAASFGASGYLLLWRLLGGGEGGSRRHHRGGITNWTVSDISENLRKDGVREENPLKI